MTGIAQHHFPRFVWRNGKKRLWNPIHRKALKNRPEERVRLRIIDALIEAGWSRHRISTEEALPTRGEPARRTDIICYDQAFNPRILVECKAESVPISSGVAEQTARYNQQVGAPFLLMTNGLRDYWYRVPGDKPPSPLEEPPEILNIPEQDPERDFGYWRERGFAGNKAGPGLREWLPEILNHYWSRNTVSASPRSRFIHFNNSPMEMELAHYFAITPIDEYNIATTFISTPFGGTRLVGVINREEENIALLEVNLDLAANGTRPNATLLSAAGPRTFDAVSRRVADPGSPDTALDPESVSRAMLKVFREPES